MGFCQSCGCKLGEGARFCPSCGTPYQGETNSAQSTASSPEGKVNSNNSTSVPSSSPLASMTGPKQSELSPILDELKRYYRTKILPVEQAFKFEDFHSPSLTDTDFESKPMVLLIGQYSTGKCWAKDTKFIMYNGEIKNVQDIKAGDRLMVIQHQIYQFLPKFNQN
jgi:hypothetical protein